MQCIRGNDNGSPPLTPTASIMSMDSVNKYITYRLNRKSFMRRSFEFVRKNFVRQSQYLLPKNSVKGKRNVSKTNEGSINDLNNNGSNYNNSRISAPMPNHHSTNTYCTGGGGGDIFELSTDSDILNTNTKRKKRLRVNVR